MIRRCETMINVTQVDERGNKSGSKDGSTICDNYSRSSMPEDNFSSKNFAISSTSAVGKAFVIAYRVE
ncbi:hypothetical protein TNCV_3832911 [Trichonephila clavipes]|nr:hypothetical protein TNCV_3832911 [Trichonephila clavipes]